MPAVSIVPDQSKLRAAESRLPDSHSAVVVVISGGTPHRRPTRLTPGRSGQQAGACRSGLGSDLREVEPGRLAAGQHPLPSHPHVTHSA